MSSYSTEDYLIIYLKPLEFETLSTTHNFSNRITGKSGKYIILVIQMVKYSSKLHLLKVSVGSILPVRTILKQVLYFPAWLLVIQKFKPQ